MTVAAAPRNVRHCFSIRSEKKPISTQKKKGSVEEEGLLSSKFSEDLIDSKRKLMKVKNKMLISHYPGKLQQIEKQN